MNQPDMDKLVEALNKRINAILAGEFRAVGKTLSDKCGWCGTNHELGACDYTKPTDPYEGVK